MCDSSGDESGTAAAAAAALNGFHCAHFHGGSLE